MSDFDIGRSMIKQAIINSFYSAHAVTTATHQSLNVLGCVKQQEQEGNRVFFFFSDDELSAESTMMYCDTLYRLAISTQQTIGSGRSQSQLMRVYLMSPHSAREQNDFSEY